MNAVVLRDFGWRRPEWTAAAIAAGGWVVAATTMYTSGHGTNEPHSQAQHHHDLPASSPDIGTWTIMAVAMMVPATLPAVRSIALASLWSRRQRAIAIFVGAYLAVWIAFGIAAVEAATTASALFGFDSATLLPVALLLAAGWELTPLKRRSLRACHLIAPPPPRGWKADAGCARAGLTYGRHCVISCWALMLAMAVGGHASLRLMLVLALIVAAQKFLVRGPELGVPASAAMVSVCVVVVLS